MQYHGSSYAEDVWDVFWYEKNLQGDIVAVYNDAGTKLVTYYYDAFGYCIASYDNNGSSTRAYCNPFRYRGYYYDKDLDLYYLNARYYDGRTGRFISPDNQLSTTDLVGMNLYAYCGNNPANRIDPTGHARYHWAIGAGIVIGCAVAVVITAGGFVAGATAVANVACGYAAATTASTIASGAFICSSIAYAGAAWYAWLDSRSVEEFNNEGNWGTVASTAASTVFGGVYGYGIVYTQMSRFPKQQIATGTSRPPKSSGIPYSRYIQYDQSTGAVRSDAVYDAKGNWYSRIDYMHDHNINGKKYCPHIHISAPLTPAGLPNGRETVLPW